MRTTERDLELHTMSLRYPTAEYRSVECIQHIAEVVVNAMQSQVADDLKGEGEAHTRLIVDEMRALRLEIEALRARATS